MSISTRYALPVFVSAFLLFQLQPVVGKYILPWYGGTPAVWTTCMLFFQLLLLAGYGYAHALTRGLMPQAQSKAHLGLLVVSLLLMAGLTLRWGASILPDAGWKPTDSYHPVSHTLALLAVCIGLPYFILSATSPLLQRWFSQVQPGASPYRLYALSNVGSLLALVSYPFLVEPALALRTQAHLWTLGYIIFAASCAGCVRQFQKSGQLSAVSSQPVPPLDSRPGATGPSGALCALWFSLATCSSLMLLAGTNQICQEVAVIPFLWVLPLSLYLVSFILCFDGEKWYSRRLYLAILGLATVVVCVVLPKGNEVTILTQTGVYLLALFACCMVCHGELARLKPSPRYLTSFYLTVAGGGAAGGIFVALLAPYLFKSYSEFQLALWICWLLLLVVLGRDRSSLFHRPRPALAYAFSLVSLVVLAKALWPAAEQDIRRVVEQSRNFYGALRVEKENTDYPDQQVYYLVHGRTTHGYQFQSASKRSVPTAYYSEESGIGVVLRNLPRHQQRGLRIGGIGLGVGTIAAYGKPGDYIRFYEINPDVIRLASGANGYFTYLSDSQAVIESVLGDARLSLERELHNTGSMQFDVLAIDAFSSDAIPIHLLTAEAFEIYLQHLNQPDGILAFHITNRYLDLQPVLGKLAEHFRLAALVVEPSVSSGVMLRSTWMLLSPNHAALSHPPIASAGTRLEVRLDRAPLWTDDYSNLFQVLKR